PAPAAPIGEAGEASRPGAQARDWYARARRATAEDLRASVASCPSRRASAPAHVACDSRPAQRPDRGGRHLDREHAAQAAALTGDGYWLGYVWRAPPSSSSPSRYATAAASVRERTSSFARMRDTCTLAVFSAMKSSWPISRLVAPRASRART